MALKHLAACALSGTLRQASRLTGIQNEPFIPKRCERGQRTKRIIEFAYNKETYKRNCTRTELFRNRVLFTSNTANEFL